MLSLSLIRSALSLGSGDDAYLTALEAGAVADVQATGQIWLGTSKAFTELYDLKIRRTRLCGPPDKPQAFDLKQYVPTIGALTISERATPVEDWEVVDHTSDGYDVFELRDGRLLVRNIGWWPEGPSTVKLGFSVGYAVDSAPAAWQAVTLDLMAWRYKTPAARGVGGNVEQAGVRGALVVFNTDTDRPSMSQEIRARIATLRRNPPPEP